MPVPPTGPPGVTEAMFPETIVPATRGGVSRRSPCQVLHEAGFNYSRRADALAGAPPAGRHVHPVITRHSEQAPRFFFFSRFTKH